MTTLLSPAQQTILEELSKGKKLFEVLSLPGMPSKSVLDGWLSCPNYGPAHQAALVQGSQKRARQASRKQARLAKPKPKKRAEQRARKAENPPIGKNLFVTSTWKQDFRGRPLTAPNTKADAQRIQQSVRLTKLIGDGDTYVTPGLNGYTEEELATAPAYYAHLFVPERPEGPLKERLLELLAAGVVLQDCLEDLEIGSALVKKWRTENETWDPRYQQAQAEGKPIRRELKKGILRDHRPKPIVLEPAPVIAAPNPVIFSQPVTAPPADRFALVLQKLRLGWTHKELFILPKVHSQLYVKWQQNPELLSQLNAAIAEGKVIRDQAKNIARERALTLERELQTQILDRVRGGKLLKDLVNKVPGFTEKIHRRWAASIEFRTQMRTAVLEGRAKQPKREATHKGKRIPRLTRIEEIQLQEVILEIINTGVNYLSLIQNPAYPNFNERRLGKWRQIPVFRQRWESALAKSRELREAPYRSSQRKQKAPETIIPDQVMDILIEKRFTSEQEAILELVTSGVRTGELYRSDEYPYFHPKALSTWLKDDDFQTRWHEANTAGHAQRGEVYVKKESKYVPVAQRRLLAQEKAIKKELAEVHEDQPAETVLVESPTLSLESSQDVKREVLRNMSLLFGQEQYLSYLRLSLYEASLLQHKAEMELYKTALEAEL